MIETSLVGISTAEGLIAVLNQLAYACGQHSESLDSGKETQIMLIIERAISKARRADDHAQEHNVSVYQVEGFQDALSLCALADLLLDAWVQVSWAYRRVVTLSTDVIKMQNEIGSLRYELRLLREQEQDKEASVMSPTKSGESIPTSGTACLCGTGREVEECPQPKRSC